MMMSASLWPCAVVRRFFRQRTVVDNEPVQEQLAQVLDILGDAPNHGIAMLKPKLIAAADDLRRLRKHRTTIVLRGKTQPR